MRNREEVIARTGSRNGREQRGEEAERPGSRGDRKQGRIISLKAYLLVTHFL